MSVKKKKISSKDRVNKLETCLRHVQQNLMLMYQERLPLEVKIGVESLFNDIEKTLSDSK